MGFTKVALSVAFLGFAGSATASTISISDLDVGSYGASSFGGALSQSAPVVMEDFEGMNHGNMADGFRTAVGTFATLGGTGSGGTVSEAGFVNDGTQLAIREGNVFGRTSTTSMMYGDSSMDQFLDSNDTFGISWEVDLGGRMFDQLTLTLSDAADVGAMMQISMGGTSETLVSAANGNHQLVVINFDAAVSSAKVLFENRGLQGNLTNDGFSLDDISVRIAPAAVPLPAGILLMGSGLAGLGMMRRRRRG